MRTLTNPMPLLVDAGSGVLGVATPIIVGNLITGFVGPNFPMLMQPGILGSAIRAAIRVGAAMLLSPVVSRVPMLDKNAFQVGEAIGIGGSFIMDLLGRPLVIGPGDQALSLQYFVSMPTAAAGQGAYFRRGAAGTGAYFRKSLSGAGALVPTPRVGASMSPRTADLFTPY